MGINAIFVIIYVAFSGFFPAEVMSALLILHCIILTFNYYKSGKKLSPILVYYLNVAIVTFCNILLISDFLNQRISAYSYFIFGNANVATDIWCIGNAFIFIGYDLFAKKRLGNITIIIDKPQQIKTLYYLMLILVFRRLLISDLLLGSITKVFSLMSSMGIIFFARLWGKTDSKEYKRYAITLCIAQTVIAILYAYLRQEFILPVVALFVGYHIGRESIKEIVSIKSLPYAIILLAFASVFNFLGSARGSLGTGLDRIGSFSTVAASKNSELTTVADRNQVEKGGLVGRMANLAQLTNVIQLVNQKGFYEGRASAPLLTALIPRFLWPEKPPIALGVWFALEIGQGLKTDTWYNNSINMTIPGELYLDFGYIGLILGGLLIGGLLALLWNSTGFFESPYNVSGILYGGYLLINGLAGIGPDLEILVTMLSFYLIFFFVKKFV